jgi:hypothetical protein
VWEKRVGLDPGVVVEHEAERFGGRRSSPPPRVVYADAEAKLLADPTTGHLRFSAKEVRAVRFVSAVEAERAPNVTTGSAGQFAIPFSLDPTVLLSSAGVISPIRQLARVIPIETDVWKGVSSAGITAAFGAESVEASDNSPARNPSVPPPPRRGDLAANRARVPRRPEASIAAELGGDRSADSAGLDGANLSRRRGWRQPYQDAVLRRA